MTQPLLLIGRLFCSAYREKQKKKCQNSTWEVDSSVWRALCKCKGDLPTLGDFDIVAVFLLRSPSISPAFHDLRISFFIFQISTLPSSWTTTDRQRLVAGLQYNTFCVAPARPVCTRRIHDTVLKLLLVGRTLIFLFDLLARSTAVYFLSPWAARLVF